MSAELPDSYESIYRRAMLQMATGDSAEAIESLLRIVNRLRRLRPETLQRKANLQDTLDAAYRAAVEFLRWEQRYDQAISIAESVLDRVPDPDPVRRQIASLMIEKGEVQDGIARLREIAETAQDFDSWADLGAEYRALKRYDQAETCYRSALRQAQDNEDAAMANLALFTVYREADRVDDALDAWDMAVVLDPDLSDGGVQAYGWLARRGDLDLARKYLDRERQPVRRQFYEGLLEWQAGNQDAARREWRRVLDMDVEMEDTDLAAWAEAALRLGEPGRADSRLAELAEDNQVPSASLVTLHGIAKLMLGEVEHAAGLFEQVAVRLRRAWPARAKIPADRWALLSSLVSDPDSLERVAGYFDIDRSGD
jgi:tetratricopeptide (TPR) repeat protein